MLLGDGQQDMDVSIVGQAVNASSRRVSYKNVYRYYKCCFLDPDTFDLEYDKTLEKDANAHTDVIFWVSLVSPTRAASAAYDGRVKIWDVETGKCLHTLRAHSDAATSICVVSPTVIITSSYDHSLKWWDIEEGTCLHTALVDQGWIYVVTMEKVYKKLLLHGSHNSNATVWDLQKKEILGILKGHGGPIFCADFFGKGAFALTGSADHLVKVWSLQSPRKFKCVMTLTGHMDSVTGVKHIKDSTAASSSSDHRILVWNILTGTILRIISAHTTSIATFSLHPAGIVLSGGYDRKLRIWHQKRLTTMSPDGATPSRSISAHNDAVRGADCTRDIIVTGGNDTMVRVWRPKLKAK